MASSDIQKKDLSLEEIQKKLEAAEERRKSLEAEALKKLAEKWEHGKEVLQKAIERAGVVVAHACNPSTREAEAGGSLRNLVKRAEVNESTTCASLQLQLWGKQSQNLVEEGRKLTPGSKSPSPPPLPGSSQLSQRCSCAPDDME
ncbi:hypothetical protein STEG23_009124 [Scotinomys teguina]